MTVQTYRVNGWGDLPIFARWTFPSAADCFRLHTHFVVSS